LEAILSHKGKSSVLDNIYFQKSTDIKRPECTPILHTIRDAIIDKPDPRIALVGYTDNLGPSEKRIELSIHRASAIKDC
jgi:outer membrane protein OmpA-like peptidoglycan-associated protein